LFGEVDFELIEYSSSHEFFFLNGAGFAGFCVVGWLRNYRLNHLSGGHDVVFVFTFGIIGVVVV
jgi:hypothetical protein